MIRIRFVTGTGLISDAIRLYERVEFPTHVEVQMPDGTLLGAHVDGGVQARQPGYDKATTTRELIVPISFGHFIGTMGSERQNDIDAMEAAFYAFLRAQIGKPYDRTAIEAFVFNRNWREPDSWFCSELVAAALAECGYLPKLFVPANRITPSNLLFGLSFRTPIGAI